MYKLMSIKGLTTFGVFFPSIEWVKASGTYWLSAFIIKAGWYQTRDYEIAKLLNIRPIPKLMSPLCLITGGTCNNILLLSLQLTESAVAKVQGILDDLLRGRCNPLAEGHIYIQGQ